MAGSVSVHRLVGAQAHICYCRWSEQKQSLVQFTSFPSLSSAEPGGLPPTAAGAGTVRHWHGHPHFLV